jgi:YHS domain-containing protein
MSATIFFLVWAALIVMMMRYGCGAHVMGHGRHGQHKRTDGHDDAAGSPAKATDPVCGMTVDTARAKSSVYEGHTYYFCSSSCREKFEAAPESYLKGQASPMPKEAHHGAQ